MPSKGNGGRAADTLWPHRAYEHRRNTDNRQRLWGNIGFADATSKTNCRSSVFLSPLLDKEFYDRSLTYRLKVVHEPRQWCAAFLRCRHITDSSFRDWAVPLEQWLYSILAATHTGTAWVIQIFPIFLSVTSNFLLNNFMDSQCLSNLVWNRESMPDAIIAYSW